MNQSILVVDDDFDIRETLKDVLESEGFSVTLAENGRHGLELLGRTKADLIFLDMMMPVMGGEEFLAEIGRSAAYRSIPVYVFSTVGTIEHLNGVAGFIQKPADIDQILDIARKECRKGVIAPNRAEEGFASQASRSIFIVEDDESIRSLYELILTEAGHQVTVFESAERALSEIPKLPAPALLLIDFSMPKINGEDFLSRLRHAVPELRSTTRIIGFSSHPPSSPEVVKFAKAVDLYMEKPSDIDELEKVILDFLS